MHLDFSFSPRLLRLAVASLIVLSLGMGTQSFENQAQVSVIVTPPHTKTFQSYLSPGKINATVSLGSLIFPDEQAGDVVFSHIYIFVAVSPVRSAGLRFRPTLGSLRQDP